jgi:L-alanine-DL-glutamate epimerase-like enolase superfamily enzyme
MSRIIDLKAHLVPLELRTQYRHDVPPLRWDCIVVQVITEDGVEGFSQPHYLGSGRSLAETYARFFKPLIVGEDIRFVEKIWRKVWAADRIGFTSLLAQGGLDVAIWDAAAKLAGIPLYQMFGAYQTSVRAYASTTTLESVQAYVDQAKGLIDEGYTAIKLHCWGDPKRDLEACEAVRDTVGSGVDLMLDVVGTYDLAAALKVGRRLQELDFHWYEEPLPVHDLLGYRELRRALDIPIAGGELLGGGLYDYPPIFADRALDIVRPGAGFFRGITPQRKAAGMAEAFNMRFEPPTYGFPLMQAANLHVICSVPNCLFFEAPVPTGMLNALTTTTIDIDEHGLVHVPTGPGIGLEIDRDELENRTSDVLS